VNLSKHGQNRLGNPNHRIHLRNIGLVYRIERIFPRKNVGLHLGKQPIKLKRIGRPKENVCLSCHLA
jgi:hypothetical protein